MSPDVTIYDSSGTKVFDSDHDTGTGQEFLEDHPNETFKILVKGRSTAEGGTHMFSGEMTATRLKPPETPDG